MLQLLLGNIGQLCIGDYEINVLWNEMKVARCPVIGRAEVVTPPVTPKPSSKVTPPLPPNRDKIILTGQGLTTARINRQAEFVIDATDAAQGIVTAIIMLSIVLSVVALYRLSEKHFQKCGRIFVKFGFQVGPKLFVSEQLALCNKLSRN